VFPSFARAVEELIENAAKHGGDAPDIAVSIEPVPNAVEIRISDDGPGLADHEADVLKTGAETPLTHGSGLGLWLVHWIVTSHDGSITATGTERGTSMTVSVPRTQTTENTTVQNRLRQLTRARDQYQAAFEEASDAIIIFNDDARILDANPAAAPLLRLDRQDLLGRTLPDLLPAEFGFGNVWQELQTTGTSRGTVKFDGEDCEDRTVEYSAQADIIPGQHLVISRDITDRTKQEQELSRLKQRYETVLDAAPDPVFVANGETGEIIEVNGAAASLIGLPRDELVGQHYTTFHPTEDAELYRDIFEQSLETQGRVSRLSNGSHIELLTADGETVPVEYSIGSVSLPDAPVIVGIFRDLSDQIERERALEDTTQRLELALEGTDTGVWDWNIETDEVRWAGSLERLVGIEPGAFEGTFDAFVERIHPDDREKVAAAVERAAQTESGFQSEFRLQCENDTPIWVESRGEVYDTGGDAKRMVGIATDITERIERKRRLELAETVFENTQDALFVIDVTESHEFYIDRVNKTYEGLTGLSRSEITGKTPRDVVGDEIGSEIESRYTKCLERQETITYREEIPVGNEQRQWETKLTPVITEERVEKLVGAMREVTAV
jgi:PAS domain S-box-containing protein